MRYIASEFSLSFFRFFYFFIFFPIKTATTVSPCAKIKKEVLLAGLGLGRGVGGGVGWGVERVGR